MECVYCHSPGSRTSVCVCMCVHACLACICTRFHIDCIYCHCLEYGCYKLTAVSHFLFFCHLLKTKAEVNLLHSLSFALKNWALLSPTTMQADTFLEVDTLLSHRPMLTRNPTLLGNWWRVTTVIDQCFESLYVCVSVHACVHSCVHVLQKNGG